MANEPKWTQGEWYTQLSAVGDVGIIVRGVGIVAECFAAIRHKDEHSTDEVMANAHLIAAAPDMYEALAAAEELHLTGIIAASNELIERVTISRRAALAKARGEQ